MPPKQKQQQPKQDKNDRLEELILKLEERLAIFKESELKQLCSKVLIDMNKTMEELQEQHQKIYRLLGLTYSDIVYPTD